MTPLYRKMKKFVADQDAREAKLLRDLTPCDEPGKLRSTDAMRKRIRELARPRECDYDRAVIAVLDDLEMKLTGLRNAASAMNK